MKKQISSKLGRQLDTARRLGGSGRNHVWKAVQQADFKEMADKAAAKFAKLDAEFQAKHPHLFK